LSWEAVLVVGSVVCVLALLLLTPALLWAKRMARRKPGLARHVTRGGAVFFGSEILLLLCGLALIPELPRNSWVARAVGPGVPTVLYIIAVMLIYRFLGRVLERRGFRAFHEGRRSNATDS
jgi:hypothetical protein